MFLHCMSLFLEAELSLTHLRVLLQLHAYESSCSSPMGPCEINLQKRRKPSLVFLKRLRKGGDTVDDLSIVTDTIVDER